MDCPIILDLLTLDFIRLDLYGFWICLITPLIQKLCKKILHFFFLWLVLLYSSGISRVSVQVRQSVMFHEPAADTSLVLKIYGNQIEKGLITWHRATTAGTKQSCHLFRQMEWNFPDGFFRARSARRESKWNQVIWGGLNSRVTCFGINPSQWNFFETNEPLIISTELEWSNRNNSTRTFMFIFVDFYDRATRTMHRSIQYESIKFCQKAFFF